MSVERASSVKDLLNIHYRYINRVVENAGSERLKKEFNSIWSSVNYGDVYVPIGETLHFNADLITSEINNWIGNMEVLLNSEMTKEEGTDESGTVNITSKNNIAADINNITNAYHSLKMAVDEIDMDFANKTRAYRSPLRQALNDITILYNKINNEEGDFSDFEDVSVYIHGIESDEEGFLESAVEAADEGEIIVHVNGNGNKEYYVVKTNIDGEKELDGSITLSEIKKMEGDGRLHVVYDTEHDNEHRQETSDDLTQQLTDMGLMNDTTKLDLFGHSYGGRRSLQFAIDYPEHVRSITTVGTPYDTNALGSAANKNGWIEEIAFGIVNPTEYSGYQDFNLDDQRKDAGVIHSNVYSDMDNVVMSDYVDEVAASNPEIYEQLQEMDILTVAGSSDGVFYLSDTVVSITSQLGGQLDIVDEKIVYDVDGIGHLNEVPSEEFNEIIKDRIKKFGE